MRRISVDPTAPDEAAVLETAQLIAKGGLAVIPTDTFYALAGNPFDLKVLERIFSVKGRPKGRPILLLIGEVGDLSKIVPVISAFGRRLIERFWPGPLTLVFPAPENLPAALTAGTGSIGIRLPDSPFIRAVCRRLGGAITGTSANLSGEKESLTAEEAAGSLGDRVDLMVNGGRVGEPVPSTVVRVVGERIEVLREGRIPRAAFN